MNTVTEGTASAAPFSGYGLVFQPQVHLDAAAKDRATIKGVEALLRTSGGESAADAIRDAEASGEIVDLGAWVLWAACRQAAAWVDKGVTLSVNVSRGQILPSLPAIVADALRLSGLPASALVLELSERPYPHAQAPWSGVLYELRELGVGLTIDNFGTGYATLAYLTALPVTGIKIAPSFIREMPQNEADRAVVKALCDLCQTKGLAVRAAGVETEAERDALLKVDCPEQQGYLHGRPVAADVMAKVLEEYEA